jgi:hypothetical protein
MATDGQNMGNSWEIHGQNMGKWSVMKWKSHEIPEKNGNFSGNMIWLKKGDLTPSDVFNDRRDKLQKIGCFNPIRCHQMWLAGKSPN